MDAIGITPPPTTTIHTRLGTDFDAGINASTAWTESLERDQSLSDEEQDDTDGQLNYLNQSGRHARALYAFEGKQEFREVCVEAGDEIEVLKEEAGDGWSLVRLVVDGAVIQLGLLPQTYYTVRKGCIVRILSYPFGPSLQQTFQALLQIYLNLYLQAGERVRPRLSHQEDHRHTKFKIYLLFLNTLGNGSRAFAEAC